MMKKSLIFFGLVIGLICLVGAASAETVTVVYDTSGMHPFSSTIGSYVYITVKEPDNTYHYYCPSTDVLLSTSLSGGTWQTVYGLGDGTTSSSPTSSSDGYIQSSGSQYINTGVYLQKNLRGVFRINPTTLSESQFYGGQESSTTGTTKYRYAIGVTTTNQVQIIACNEKSSSSYGWIKPSTYLSTNTDYIIDFALSDTTETTSINGIEISSITDSGINEFPTTPVSTIPVYMMSVYGWNSGNGLIGKFYNGSVYVSDTLVRNFIPIQIGSSGEYALYDISFKDNGNTKVIYTNDGSGSFSGGGTQSALTYTHMNRPTINDIELDQQDFGMIYSEISGYVNASPSSDGLTLSYQWAYSTDSAVSWSNISGQTSATLSYTPQTAGTYYFKVYVSDSGEATDSYTAGFTNVFVKVLDVYTPGNVSTKTSSIQAKTLETYQATNEFDFGSTILDVKYVDDTTAYVAAGNAIYVVDGTGATISPLTTYTGNTISSVYLGSTRAIINDVDNNVAVYDYTAQTMEYIATNGSSKVAISPNYAYVVNDTGWLNIYNSSGIIASMNYTYPYLEVNQETDVFGYYISASDYYTTTSIHLWRKYINYYSFDGSTISSGSYQYVSTDGSSATYIAKPIDDTNNWVLSGSNLDIYIIGITSAGAGTTTVHITTAYTPNNIDVAETLSSIFNAKSVIYVYGNDAALQGQYSAGGSLNDVSLSHSNGLYAIGAGNDSNAYFINKESSSSWVLGQATNFKETVYHSQISYDGQMALIGTTNKLFLFKYSESVESTYYINGVVVGSDGLPYANKIITIDATSITTDDSGFFVYPVKPGQTYTIITGSKTTKYTATNQALQTLSIKITSQLVAQDVTYGASYNSTSSNIEMTYNDAADKTSIVVWSVRDTKTGAEVSRQSVSAGTQAYYFVPSNKTSDNYFVTVSATRGNTSVKNTWSITPSGEGQSVNLFGMDDTGKNIIFGFFIILLAGLFGYLHQHIGTIIVAFAAAILRYLGLITVPWIMILIAVVVAIVAAIAHRGEGK